MLFNQQKFCPPSGSCVEIPALGNAVGPEDYVVALARPQDLALLDRLWTVDPYPRVPENHGLLLHLGGRLLGVTRYSDIVRRSGTESLQTLPPEEAVLSELVSDPNSLVTGKNTGIFIVGASEYD